MNNKQENNLAGLLRAAIEGDARAYDVFLRQAAKLVRAFAARRIVDGSLNPEDIVQETLLAIHLKRHSWRADSPVMPWLYAIARYKLIDAFRRRGRHVEIDIDEIAQSMAAPEVETLASWEVERALAMLSPNQRSVVAVICVDGHSIGDAARDLGMSEGAVRVALHRGLAAIARHFGKRSERD
ncbi:sigma-70 family RNA polymerase sigma factor [Mesorhizobium sp. 1M-11]|uniref:sigma-70 family RNA polymerase sigma factor n=1 Tax=Mesorhizobium sp. 1M-11 TaxID=1529006 RepID=UPI0006C73AE3|nr:sigma-70 family RNA polymerase sigma factor [Mesorhizobium sp. 1M-11]